MFLVAIGKCHRRLQQLATFLKKAPGVLPVTHIPEMPEINDIYRLEEYVDAELDTGDAISWCLEITVTESAILVDADVRHNHGRGQDLLVSVGTYEYSTILACSAQLPDLADRLCSAHSL